MLIFASFEIWSLLLLFLLFLGFSWRHFFGATQVSNLSDSFFHHEDIEWLQILMNDALGMKILQTQRDVDEYLPNDVVDKGLAFLLLFINIVVEITQLAVFYNYIYLLVIDETIEVPNDVGRF
jgi:hypothetical protein